MTSAPLLMNGKRCWKSNTVYFNEEAERIVLCMLMLNNSEIDRISGRLKDSDFYYTFHKNIYLDILGLHKKNSSADIKSIANEFKKRGDEDKIAGLAEISNTVGSSANIDYYITEIKDKSIKRELFKIATNINTDLKDASKLGVDILDEAQKIVSETAVGACGSDYKHVRAWSLEVVERIEHSIRTNGAVVGVQSCFKGLQEMVDYRKDEYIVLGARPSLGKTSFMLEEVCDIAVNRNIPTGLFSIEMSSVQLNLRMLSSMTGLNSWMISKGMYKTGKQTDVMFEALSRISSSPLYIDDTGTLKTNDLVTKARRMKYVNNVEIIFIDYFGLIDNSNSKIPRWEQMSEVSRTIKGLCKELHIPIVVLSQVVRDKEGKKPTLSDLRETGSIEQDSDVVMFLHRDREEYKEEIQTSLIVAKNRNGPIGFCDLIYKPKITKFIDSPKNIDYFVDNNKV
jgi:replicative DNA helicase